MQYVIGDIHGSLKALEEVISKTPIKKNDTLIFLGDYVDGWSDNLNTIEFLINLNKSYSCIFLRGNHDDLLYNYLTKKEANPQWVNHGGAATIKNYENATPSIIKKHIEFLENLQYYYIDNKNNLFVHAGFSNINGPQFEYFKVMLYWDRSLWEMAQCIDPTLTKNSINYPNRLKLFNEIYIGHTPVSKTEVCPPKNMANVWNVDTGAAYKGVISILNCETKQFWQSRPVTKWYPNEQGRN